jgi:uncharacterized membrane protein
LEAQEARAAAAMARTMSFMGVIFLVMDLRYLRCRDDKILPATVADLFNPSEK